MTKLRLLPFLLLLLSAWGGPVVHGANRAEPAAKPATPTKLFLIGDSTVKNGSGRGDRGQWGWGQVLQKHFDLKRLQVENRARGGRSSRTFLTEGLWQETLDRLQPGDFVMMQFGHNDGGKMFATDRPRASIKGNSDESQEGVVEVTGKAETVRSFGWYLRNYVKQAQAKGAVPIVLSLVPRDIWREDRLVRASNDYGKWAREAAEQSGALFLDLNALVADRYEQDGQETVHNQYFTSADHTHTSRLGAEVNAECVARGVAELADCGLQDFLLPSAQAALQFELGQVSADEALDFSAMVPERNHRVRLTLGHPKKSVRCRVEAELRRELTDELEVPAGQTATFEVLVNTRTPYLPHGKQVRLKSREIGKEAAAWDSRLSLRLVGENPSLSQVEILPAENVPTLFLLGDSTVADQPNAPWGSWGQALPRFFGTQLAVANHSESGETITGFWHAGRCDKVLNEIRPGDWVMIQFGHNDMKRKQENALQQYKDGLKRMVLAARERGANPVLVTSMERIFGIDKPTLGAYPDTVRALAAEEKVPLIDLHARSIALYKSLGDKLESAFQDRTHHTSYGARLIASCVVDGIRDQTPELAAYLTDAKPVRP